MDRALFGSRLRLARERSRLTLHDLAKHTKLHASLFQSLEEGTCRGWPIGVYSRAHVRTYAELVGLEGSEVVEEFAALFPHLAWSEQDQSPEVVAALRPSGLTPGGRGSATAPLRLLLEEEQASFWRSFLIRVAWLLHRTATGAAPVPAPANASPGPDVADAETEAAALVPFGGWQVER